MSKGHNVADLRETLAMLEREIADADETISSVEDQIALVRLIAVKADLIDELLGEEGGPA